MEHYYNQPIVCVRVAFLHGCFTYILNDLQI